jgi:hypothetical protein
MPRKTKEMGKEKLKISSVDWVKSKVKFTSRLFFLLHFDASMRDDDDFPTPLLSHSLTR